MFTRIDEMISLLGASQQLCDEVLLAESRLDTMMQNDLRMPLEASLDDASYCKWCIL